MKYIFCSSIYNMKDYDYISKHSKVPASLADHNLNNNVIIGLDEVTNCPIRLINNVPLPSFPKFPKIIFHKQEWEHCQNAKDINCGFINLPILKHISRAITTFECIKKEIQVTNQEPVCLITYDLHPGIALSIKMIKRLFPQIITIAYLPDIPNAVVVAANDGKNSLRGKIIAQFKMSLINIFDAYVFITKYMENLQIVRGKPFTVIEGIYDNHQLQLAPKTTPQRIIFYSGQLNPAYGINNLLDAFLQIYELDSNYELWICGSGAASIRITQLAKECKGIKYFGYVNAERVRTLQAEATVMINPRQNIGELTKYSFPSKTMEYLASGRVVVGYKLDGIPDEYDDYIQYVPNDSIESLRDTLVEACQMSDEKRNKLGLQARSFILDYKTPAKQCLKIVNMINQMMGETKNE